VAKQTTDEFKVKVIFESVEARFKHLLRTFFNKTVLNVNQTNHDSLASSFTIQAGFKTDEEKWKDLFHKGEWVTSFVATTTSSTPLVEEFDITVVYKGGQKDFKKSFHPQQMGKTFKYEVNGISSKTKNLGVLKPQGGRISDDHKQSLGIMKLYFQEVMEKAGFERKRKVQDVQSYEQFAITEMGDKYFTDVAGERLICVHLKNWKVGFCPFPKERDKVKILVSYPKPTAYGRTTPIYENWDGLLGGFQRVLGTESKQYPGSSLVYRAKVYQKYFIGDPKMDVSVIKFIKALDSLHPSLVT